MSQKGAASGFRPVVMIALVLVGVLSFAALGVLSAYEPETRSGNDGRTHALSNASVGFRGLAELLRLTQAPVILSRGRLSYYAIDSLLVLTPQAGMAMVDIDGFAHDGPMLVVLPKWQTVPANRRGWVNTAGVLPPEAALSVLPQDLRAGLSIGRSEGSALVRLSRPNGERIGEPVEIDSLQTASGKGWIPVVVGPTGDVVLLYHEDRWLYLLAEPDLINTYGLRDRAGARTALDVLAMTRSPDAPVIFDLTLHGFERTRSLFRLMLEPPLLGATLVLAALIVLAGFQAAVRFGAPRERGRRVAFGKRALADNTAGLVRLARREHRMARPYAHMIRLVAARAIGAPRSLEGADLDAFLDRVGRLNGATDTYSDLARQAQAAGRPSELIAVARALHRWKQELTHGRQ